MSGLRFSIANLLAAIALIGGGLAALRAPSPDKAAAVAALTIGILLIAVLAAAYRADESRAFWLGAAKGGAAKGGRNRFAHPKMNSSTASRGAFAILVALPLLPVCGLVLHGEPAMVFFIGATSFICGVLLLVWLFVASCMPVAGSLPVAK